MIVKDWKYGLEPGMLDYEPIPEDSIALFTPSSVGGCSELARRNWHAEDHALLGHLDERRGPKPDPWYNMRDLACALELIASWDCPDMEKEVRRESGVVQEIDYFINGQRVLWLEHGEEHEWSVYPLFTTFWGESQELTFKGLLEDFRRILTNFSRFCGERMPEMIAREERRAQNAQLKAIAQEHIAVLVANLMNDGGFSYDLEEESQRALLWVRMGENRLVELSLPHASFIKRMGELLPTLQAVEGFLEQVKIPLTIDSNAAGISAEWGSVYREELEDTTGRLFESHFWSGPAMEYANRVLFGGAKMEGKAWLDMEDVYSWDIPGLEVQVVRPYFRRGDIGHLDYSLGGRPMFSISSKGLEYSFFPLVHVFQEDEDMPALSAWRAFLEGFADFYRSHQADYQAAKLEAAKVLKLQRMGQQGLEAALRTIMGQTGYEWALELRWVDMYKGEAEMPARLYVRVKGKRVLTLFFDYVDFAEHLPVLLPAISQVMQLVREYRLPFRVLDSAAEEFAGVAWRR